MAKANKKPDEPQISWPVVDPKNPFVVIGAVTMLQSAVPLDNQFGLRPGVDENGKLVTFGLQLGEKLND